MLLLYLCHHWLINDQFGLKAGISGWLKIVLILNVLFYLLINTLTQGSPGVKSQPWHPSVFDEMSFGQLAFVILTKYHLD